MTQIFRTCVPLDFADKPANIPTGSKRNPPTKPRPTALDALFQMIDAQSRIPQ
ncbi:hypothetical protein [Bacillus sp. OK048]|uniref:hypothetical protein n=1 Tax=Bacillus sp. OK048 TaxID=1882761 RepID=UPI001C318D90|nr:hypothetical protein [Bacillus sp. OK048]